MDKRGFDCESDESIPCASDQEEDSRDGIEGDQIIETESFVLQKLPAVFYPPRSCEPLSALLNENVTSNSVGKCSRSCISRCPSVVHGWSRSVDKTVWKRVGLLQSEASRR